MGIAAIEKARLAFPARRGCGRSGRVSFRAECGAPTEGTRLRRSIEEAGELELESLPGRCELGREWRSWLAAEMVHAAKAGGNFKKRGVERRGRQFRHLRLERRSVLFPCTVGQGECAVINRLELDGEARFRLACCFDCGNVSGTSVH